MATRPVRRRKVLLIGWDAADWKVIHPLMDAGQMPTMQTLVQQGAIANLATLHPVLSPMLWTSIATGKRPFKHGILGFTEPTPDGQGIRPITNLARQGKALWNILNQHGLRSIVVGWWPSHPVEPINGVMVSNHYHQAVGPMDKPWPLRQGTVHPARLADALADLRLHPQELAAEHILPFLPRAAEIDQNKDRRLATVAKLLAECTTVHAAATWLMQHEPWDFMAVYYDAIDHFCHAFMRYHPPRRPHIPERDYELYQGVVSAGYRYHDMMLRTLLQLAGEDTTVIVVSDHGFHPDHLRPARIPHEPAGPAIEHRDFGILAMRGPGIKADEHLYGVTLLDVTPTILTLYGLPVGADMDGAPVVTAFEHPPEIATIPSWDTVPGDAGIHPDGQMLDPFAPQEALAQLVALGYIERPEANRARTVARTVEELRYNLARSYMDADRYPEAISVLQQLYTERPDEYRFGVQLAMCYRAMERIAELRQLVDTLNARCRQSAAEARRALQEWTSIIKQRRQERAEAVATEAPPAGATPGRPQPLLSAAERQDIRRRRAQAQLNPFALDYLAGYAQLAAGDPATALTYLARAEQTEAERPGLHLQIGEAYLKLKRPLEAERSFARAAEIDPENPHAHLGLCRTYLLRRQNRQAASKALEALGLLYHYPLAHFCLGVALHRMGQVTRAVQAFDMALTCNPNFVEAHTRLAYLYEHRLHDQARAAVHRQLAQDIRRTASGTPVATTQPTGPASLPGTHDSHPETPARRRAVPAVVRPWQECITVVSGLPRSGTSMLMQLLAAGGVPLLSDGVRQADADNPRGYFEFEAVKKLPADHAWLGTAIGQAVKIVAQLVPALPADFSYKVLFIERDLREVLASQRRMLERQGRQGAQSQERLMAIFAQQVRHVQDWLEHQDHIETLYLQHRDMLAHPERMAGIISRFLGAGLDSTAMAAAVDRSLHRQHVSL